MVAEALQFSIDGGTLMAGNEIIQQLVAELLESRLNPRSSPPF